MTIAFVYPGQGAQTIGMGRDLADAYPAAKAVFDEVDEALGEKLSTLIWEGDADELTLTQNAQPALMATSMAAMAALKAEGVTVDKAAYVAGHSLGEYAALCAAGTFSLADTARLLRIRGRAMQAAVPVGQGAMAALLGLSFDQAEAVAAEAAQGEVCQVANQNDPAQNVVSGSKAAVERAIDLAKAAGAKRALLLPVSAPFHCALMAPAAEEMAGALADVTMNAPAVPVVANVVAEAVTDPEQIRKLLLERIAQSDAVITTALVPGKKAPLLMTTEMVEAMSPGALVVDLAAEQGGNCELTEAGETVEHNGVKIIGPVDLPSTMAVHASDMYSRNISTYLLHLVNDGKLNLDPEDELVTGPRVSGELDAAAAKEEENPAEGHEPEAEAGEGEPSDG